jgi:putative GTP pyrophosphokinase
VRKRLPPRPRRDGGRAAGCLITPAGSAPPSRPRCNNHPHLAENRIGTASYAWRLAARKTESTRCRHRLPAVRQRGRDLGARPNSTISDVNPPGSGADEPLTVSQINKAGRAIRHRTDPTVTADQVDQALRVIEHFRAKHAYALTKATMGLRSAVQAEGCAIEVSQRLKRITTIIDKLGREPTMQLSRMQDIGGCRAVLPLIADVRRVEQRLKKRPTLRIRDYASKPRESGYRAVHVVRVYKDKLGVDRAIEIQLRTVVMHEWAIFVERLSGRIGDDLKSRGALEVRALLAAISEAMATEEAGKEVPSALVLRMEELRRAALPYLPR